MPYIAIKAHPRDMELKKQLVEKINQDLIDIFNCPPHAVTISFEEVTAEDWEEKVVKPEIEPNEDKMMIRSGERKY